MRKFTVDHKVNDMHEIRDIELNNMNDFRDLNDAVITVALEDSGVVRRS